MKNKAERRMMESRGGKPKHLQLQGYSVAAWRPVCDGSSGIGKHSPMCPGGGGGGREVVPSQRAGPLATQGALTLPAGPAGGQGAPRRQQMSQCRSKELKFPVPRHSEQG